MISQEKKPFLIKHYNKLLDKAENEIMSMKHDFYDPQEIIDKWQFDKSFQANLIWKALEKAREEEREKVRGRSNTKYLSYNEREGFLNEIVLIRKQHKEELESTTKVFLKEQGRLANELESCKREKAQAIKGELTLRDLYTDFDLAEEREDGFREGFEVGAKRANKELEKQVLEVKASAQNELEEAVKKAREEARIGFCIRCGLKTHPKNTKARLCKKCRLNHTRWESKIDAAVLARTKKIFEEIDKLCYSEQGDHWLKKMNLTVEEKEKIKSRFFGGK